MSGTELQNQPPRPRSRTGVIIVSAAMIGLVTFTPTGVRCAAARAADSHSSGGGAFVTRANLGPQLPGQVVHVREAITNRGTTKIRFSKVVTTCGCLGGFLTPEVVSPGKTGILHLRLSTVDSPVSERVAALIYGTTGTVPVAREYQFDFSVHRMIRITVPAASSPAQSYYLNLGTLRPNSRQRAFKLAVARGSYPGHWTTLGCTTNPRAVAVRLRRISADKWWLYITPKVLTVLGQQSHMLRFSFYWRGHELSYHFSEPVNFRVQGPVALEPGSIFFGVVRAGSTVSKQLRLVVGAMGYASGGKILSVKSTVPAQAKAVIADGGKVLQARFHAVGKPGRHVGRFLVNAVYHEIHYQFRVDYLADVLGNGEKN